MMSVEFPLKEQLAMMHRKVSSWQRYHHATSQASILLLASAEALQELAEIPNAFVGQPEQPAAAAMDAIIVKLDEWATFFHNRRSGIEDLYKEAAHYLARARILLFGEP